jgi:hypothetical protein
LRFRSAGLGPTELKGSISSISPVGKELLVLHIKTHSPVEWHLKAGLEPRDVPMVIKGILKPAIIFHIVRTLFYLKKSPKELKDIMDPSISL